MAIQIEGVDPARVTISGIEPTSPDAIIRFGSMGRFSMYGCRAAPGSSITLDGNAIISFGVECHQFSVMVIPPVETVEAQETDP